MARYWCRRASWTRSTEREPDADKHVKFSVPNRLNWPPGRCFNVSGCTSSLPFQIGIGFPIYIPLLVGAFAYAIRCRDENRCIHTWFTVTSGLPKGWQQRWSFWNFPLWFTYWFYAMFLSPFLISNSSKTTQRGSKPCCIVYILSPVLLIAQTPFTPYCMSWNDPFVIALPFQSAAHL